MAKRIETFAVDRRGDLVRQVVPARGRPYEHRCSLANFRDSTRAKWLYARGARS